MGSSVRLRTMVAPVCATVVALVGAVVLLGWALDIQPLKTVLPRLVSMKVNTAIAFLLAGMSLALRCVDRRRPAARTTGVLCALLVGLVGMLTLVEWFGGPDLVIDQILIADRDVSPDLGRPGRMAPNTALNFCLVALTLVLLHLDRALRVAQSAALGTGVVTLLAVTGYAYGLLPLYSLSSYTPMALHTTATFMVLAVGLLAVHPDRGLLAALASRRGGATLARRLLPAATVVPLGLGFICLTGYRESAFGAEFAIALLAVSNVVVLFLLLWGGARTLNVIDEERLRAEESLRRDEEGRRAAAHAQRILETAPDAFVAIESSGRITAWNPQATALFGWSREEALDRPVAEIIPALERRAAGKRIELTAVRRSGEELLVEITMAPLLLDDGGIVYNAFIHDITERKRAEADLARAKANLERQTQILRSILHDMGEGVVVADENGAFILFNPAAERILGLGAIEGGPARWPAAYGVFRPDRETPFPADQLPLARAIRGLESNDVEQFVRNEQNPKGTLISSSGRPLHDAAGVLKGGIVVFHDVTERRGQEERRLREITALNELGELLQACQTMEEAYELVGQKARELFPGQSGALFVVGPQQPLAETKASWGKDPILPPHGGFLVEECWALRRGQVHYVPDVTAGLACKHVAAAGSAASLCVPLSIGAEPLGVLMITVKSPTADDLATLAEDRRPLASTVARQVSLAMANLRLRETLHEQSIRDPLTGLFNRRYMEESLGREMFRADRNRQPVAVIMLDVDHFKRFNDTYGHDAGDAVLRALGELLRHGVRGTDIACRLGGEEMAMILPDSSLAGGRQRAEAILQATRNLRVEYHGETLGVTVSLGVAAYPLHGASLEEVLRVADDALYRAKREGRDRVVTAAADASPSIN